MNNSNLISIIIPTYNSSQYIKEAIDSALSQSYKNIEIIIVDDGSTDNTEDVIKSYNGIEKIIYIKKRNGGPASARNLGITQAKGNYIAFLDADDIWDKCKLEKQMDIARKKNLDLVHTNRFYLDQKDKISDSINLKTTTTHLIKENFITNSSVMIKTDVLKNNLFNESPKLFAVEDYDLWLRLSFQKYSFGYIPEKLTGYRRHTNQISSNNNISNLTYLYWNSINNTNNYLYKIGLLYMYIKIYIFSLRLKA